MPYEYKIGPYHFDAPGDCQQKVFADEGGGTRTFSVIIASAYNAGIIGSEHNGVAVLDEDNRCVVFDRGGKTYDVAAQRLLAAELMKADWSEFTRLLKAQPHFRDSVPDIHASEPAYTYPMPASENWAVMDVDQEGPEADPVVYTAKNRADVVAELIKHAMHQDGPYRPWRLAWNIKVGSFDDSGKVAGIETNPDNDERWAERLEEDSSIFHDACNSAISLYTDGLYTTFPGDDQGDYQFEIEGRSGGWLVLSEVRGLGKLAWSSQGEMEEALMSLDRDDLRKIYRAVKSLDHDLSRSNIAKIMAYEYAQIRVQAEEEWADTPTPA